MSSRTQAFVLLLFAAALLRLGTSDVLLRFVKESARPWVLSAGVAMVLLAIWSLLAGRHAHGADHEADHGADGAVDEHGHGAASRAGWLVVLPVIAVLVIGPPALGGYTASRRDPVATRPGGYSFERLPSGDPVRLGVFDYALRAIGDDGRTLRGRTVTITGFVAEHADGGFVLARLVITCCAADASPVTVRVRTSQPVPAPEHWVRVSGRNAAPSSAEPDVPVLDATAVTPVPTPAEPYD